MIDCSFGGFRMKKMGMFVFTKQTIMKYILFSLFFSYTFLGLSQHEPTLNVFWNNYTFRNPAMTGLINKHEASVNFQENFTFKSAPTTLVASYATQIDKVGGLGVNYVYDQYGFMTRNQANLNYSYHFKFSDTTQVLALGIGLGLVNVSSTLYGFEGINVPTNNTTQNQNGFTLNAGIAYKNNSFTAGLGLTQVNEVKLDRIYFQQKRHIHVFVDYTFQITNNLKLKPTASFVTDSDFHTTEFNLLAIIKNSLWVGASYRSRNYASVMLGYDIQQKFRIGYAHGFHFSQLNSGVDSGTHELVLGFIIR